MWITARELPDGARSIFNAKEAAVQLYSLKQAMLQLWKPSSQASFTAQQACYHQAVSLTGASESELIDWTMLPTSPLMML